MNQTATATATEAANGVGRALTARLAAQAWQLNFISRDAEHLTAARVTGQVWSTTGGFSGIRAVVR